MPLSELTFLFSLAFNCHRTCIYLFIVSVVVVVFVHEINLGPKHNVRFYVIPARVRRMVNNVHANCLPFRKSRSKCKAPLSKVHHSIL